MSIIMYLGRNVNEYNEVSKSMIDKYIKEKKILCEYSLEPMKRHSSYERGLKDLDEKITIIFVQCKKCAKKHGHALLPDFVLRYKRYSGNEIEGVIIDSASCPIKEIDTEASESTVRRWIKQIGSRIVGAVSLLKSIFLEMGRIISELQLNPGHCYNELEQILDREPSVQRYSGNKLGHANIWLARHNRTSYI